ncbi:hypothetical protein PR048_033783 [Dryococelus australis]|uniref:Reverse transcriptase n=1 Tax=Dryococelus australis TaxID=614101 RepID=A0ABQ9FZX6_9NEOP|nr:hypothetical protein PR048_033783 [Dryococelus australis]
MESQGFKCRWCARTFSTKSGTALHEKRAHEAEFNAALQGPPKGHTLWTDEELRILALEEIYLPASTRHINLALVAAKVDYHPAGGGPSTYSVSRGDQLSILLELLEDVQDESWRPDILEGAVRNVRDGLSPSDDIDRWLRSTFKIKEEVLLSVNRPEDRDDDPHGMATIISSEEVERSEISGQSAPGPDGILVQQWRKVPTGKDHPAPKSEIPSTPAEFRPISISSVVMRHYHKILAQRIQKVIKIAPQQRAFQCADGLAENLSLLSEVLYSASSQLRSTYMAVLDVKKAFDTVQHGDPLSPVLFNIVMDSALAKLNPNVGVQLGNDTISYLAFADDVILMARSSTGLQSNLDILCDGLAKMGLMLSVEKSHSLAIVAVGKTRKMKVLDEPTLRVGDSFVPPWALRTVGDILVSPSRHVGLRRSGRSWRNRFGVSLRLPEASSKDGNPKKFLMPSLIHQLSFARVSLGILKALDVVVRASVRRWLKLPKDVALGIFHAPPSSPVPPARSLVNCPLFSKRIEWAERAATVNGFVLDNTLKVKNYWSARLLASVDGKDLVAAKSTKLSTSWLVADARLVPARDYISYLQIISNSCLPNLELVVVGGPKASCPNVGQGVMMSSPRTTSLNNVVQASNLDWSYNTKIKKYATKDLLATVMAESGAKESVSELQDMVGGGPSQVLGNSDLVWYSVVLEKVRAFYVVK